MKIPIYITDEQKKYASKIFRNIRIKEGIDTALLFRNLATCAMYGQMIYGKITFDGFLEQVYRHIAIKNQPFHTFWNLNIKEKLGGSRLFTVPIETIVKPFNGDMEKYIVELMTIKNSIIGKTYKQNTLNKMFKYAAK